MMTRLKRWTHQVVARVDRVIVQIENHAAQADDALSSFERSVLRARAQCEHVQRDGRALLASISEERQAERSWRERARREPGEDRALECLRRSRQARLRAEELTRSQVQHEQSERRLCEDLASLERRLFELCRERDEMRARQQRAVETASEPKLDDPLVEEIFERWESQLAVEETVRSAANVELDRLEQRFVEAELLLELRALKEEV